MKKIKTIHIIMMPVIGMHPLLAVPVAALVGGKHYLIMSGLSMLRLID
jgi:hypothetical protein